MSKQFITDIVEAKRNEDGSFATINPTTMENSSVVAKGDPETGEAVLELGKGATGLEGQYFAANFDTFKKTFTGQLFAIAPFQVAGEPDFNPQVNVTSSGIDVTNNSSAADASSSSSSASSASASNNSANTFSASSNSANL